MKQIVLKMSQIDKKFAGVHALKKIDFELAKGEVHALLGGNGAGKSTLIKILGGVHKPDSGTIKIDEKQIEINNVQEAQRNKIGIIHQEIVLVPHLTVAENIFLGREPSSMAGVLHKTKLFEKTAEIFSGLKLDIDAYAKVVNLTIAQQQLVEIVKAISFDARILVMDEPTSSLEDNEVKILFETINNFKNQGVSIIYISHKMDEIFKISDRVTVLRDGCCIGTCITSETNTDELVNMMVGRSIDNFYTRNNKPGFKEVMRVEGLTKKGAFRDINFSIREGEVLGFAGLGGAGRSEIMLSIFGADHYDSGKIYLEGQLMSISSPIQAIEKGIALVPEERKKQGLVLTNSVAFNLTLPAIRTIAKNLVIDKRKYQSLIQTYIDRLSIVTPSSRQLVMNLSGGNQQKIVVAKWLATSPRLLILDEPTKGIDVGAKKEIYTIIDELSGMGLAIIMISSELPEIINMCDRVCVVREGQIAAQIDKAEISQTIIMHYATGGLS